MATELLKINDITLTRDESALLTTSDDGGSQIMLTPNEARAISAATRAWAEMEDK